MRSSEDSADDEFVFVTNKEVKVQTCAAGPAPRATGRLHRHHHRLNQPIPTTLDLDPPSGSHSACAALPHSTTTTTTSARAKVTPLPPELIELLPPHLRENTIPDFSAASHAAYGQRLPGRPGLPLSTDHHDYCDPDDARGIATSPHSFEHLSELVSSSDAFSSTSDDASSSQNHSRASSLPLQRPCPPPSSTGTSHTAPPTLTLTDSGISSAGSSSISSRSSSSKSLPRENPRILNGRPLPPESPRGPTLPQRNGAVSGVAGSASSSTKISNSVVLLGNEDRLQGRGRLVTRSPSPSLLLATCRASPCPQEGVNEAAHYSRPTQRVAHHPMVEAEHWERHEPHAITSRSGHSAFVPTSTRRLNQTPTRDMRNHLSRENSPNRVEVSTGSGVAFYNVHKAASCSPTRTPRICCTPPPQSACRHAQPSPPPSPELQRAWNVVGVPVSSGNYGGRNSPVGSVSPTPLGHPANYRLGVPRSDPNAIYDNIMLLRHSSQSPIRPAPAASPCLVAHSPVLGKPPSPPQQRRVCRSPSPGQGWVSVSRSASPHCAPCHHHAPNLQHGGCWVPVWGSSPQLCPEGGGHACSGYLYNSPPCAVACGSRSHSCERLPAHPSPPPSPVCGRRSPSPWREGSAPPVSHRHSPSPDRPTGRPPRPRRPPHRKAKTVEVGYLGSTSHSPNRAPSPAMATPMYMSASAIMTATSHPGATQPSGTPLYQNLRNHSGDAPGLGHGGGARPMVAASPPPRPSSGADKQEVKSDLKLKGSSLEDRVMRLEGDKESLQLQVTVLTEQVEAQAEKITDLENLLDDKKEQLQKTEEQLQKEIIIRTSLETQRLELVSEISNMKLHQAAYERENLELRDKIRHSDHQSDNAKMHPVTPGASLGRSGSGRGVVPAAASTPVRPFIVTPDSPQAGHQLAAALTNSPSPSSISTLSTIPASSPNKSPAQAPTASPASSPVASHDAREYLPPRTPPPNARRKIDQFGTVPRQREMGVGGENNQTAANTARTKGVMFAETEMQMIEDLPEGEYKQHDGLTSPESSSPRGNTLAGHRSPPTHPKATGIKKIFTKLRRSSSGHLDGELGDGDFRRGGMRATASARLGWTSPSLSFKEPGVSFDKWSVETLENWLGALGLSQYCTALRSWTHSGHHLSKATPQNLERELGIRHPLHRKKLQLAISARLSGDQLNTPLHRLDHSWVLRWLDDVGLPQYKDAFSEARIDGRVLNCLTYDDLSFLRLSNLLHVTSLKRGIQVLREHNFDPSVLKRRSVPDEDPSTRTAAQVSLWTNHRVMEWLRTVDLSEYAPNLRGSGVHGALMVYEVRFTSELLASLLSIPSGKTLLRRHLNTHFKELVGRSVVQEKRELEAASGYTPLTSSAKVKMPKKSQFSLKRKKTKSELEFDDLLCPLDEKPPLGALQDREKEHLQRSSAPPAVGRITKV
ncbi:hypothetical protein O3P69_000746 [Scylla paramamosain]|uniref:SAM domain-containing protein n=1 Tax=Scylla paramamosain TaxID=85552 RepID=A0AAW0UQX7_SCYPA